MRILQISHMDWGGGAANSAWYLFNAYHSLGHESLLSVGRKKTRNPNTWIKVIPNFEVRKSGFKFLQWPGQVILPLEGKIRGVGRWYNFWTSLALRICEPAKWFNIQNGFENFNFPGTWRILNRLGQKPDIIHCHNLHGNYFDLRILPWLSHQRPVILSLHDSWLLSGHCAHSFECEKWKYGCGNCSDINIPPAIKRDNAAANWKLKKEIYAKSRLYVTTPSQWLMDKVNHSMLNGVKTKLIPNGIDLSIFCPGNRRSSRSELGFPQNAKIVLFVAKGTRSNIWKDYDTMKKAIELVSVKVKRQNILFICIGEKGKTKQVSSCIKIEFVPYIEHHRVVRYYQSADIYIHAAKADTFPMTVTEALACGIPVVATEVGGIPEQIKHGETGFLVPPGDAEAMADRVVQLLENDDVRMKMKERATVDAQHRFGLELQVKNFLAWYEEVIDDWENAHE